MKTHVIKLVDNCHGHQGYVSLDGRKYQPTPRQWKRLAQFLGRAVGMKVTKYTAEYAWWSRTP